MKITKQVLKRIIKEELGDPKGEGEYERKRQAGLKKAAAAASQKRAGEAAELEKQMSQPVDMSLASSEVRTDGSGKERKIHKLPISRLTSRYDAAGVVVNNPELLDWVKQNVAPGDRVMGQKSFGGPDPDDIVDGDEFMSAVEYMEKTKDTPPIEHPTQAQKDAQESDYFNEGRSKMKITKQRLARIIKEALAEANPAGAAMKADIARHHKEQGTTPKGTGTPVPNALDTADAWFNEFMKMIKREFSSSGWSMAGIGSELLEAIEKLQRQVKDEVDAANKKDYRE